MKLPKRPPKLSDLLAAHSDRLVDIISQGTGKRTDAYHHWDKLRFRPLPQGVNSHEEWWLATKLVRMAAFKALPLQDADGEPFVYWLPDPLQEMLHKVDQDASGRIELPGEVVNPGTRDRYLVSSLFEEAITSSQLEGASTTRRVAKAMLREGRHPRNRSERMIVNNYRAMEFIRDVAAEDLTRELLLHLHGIVTEGTLEGASAEGRFRVPSDNVAVVDARDNTVLHEPPDAGELDARIDAVCEFANGRRSVGFLHPVIKSILLHFMIGYEHPFVDGNGRAARALFYWSMARHGYWMMEFVSISTILRKGPAQYARAFLHTESDDNDATYFIDFNLRVMMRAIVQLHEYLSRKAAEVRSVDRLLGSSDLANLLNHRQIALLSHTLRNPDATYTIQSHQKSHRVTNQTARTDLMKLVDHGLLTMNRRGKAYAFRALPDPRQRIACLAGKQ